MNEKNNKLYHMNQDKLYHTEDHQSDTAVNFGNQQIEQSKYMLVESTGLDFSKLDTMSVEEKITYLKAKNPTMREIQPRTMYSIQFPTKESFKKFEDKIYTHANDMFNEEE